MGDTDVRMDDKKYREDFEFVQRVYKTTSKQAAKDMEVYLIKKFKQTHGSILLNVSEAPASRLTTYNGFYYVYIVYNQNE